MIPDESRVCVCICMIIANGVRRSSSNEIESALCVINMNILSNLERTHTHIHVEFVSNTVSKRTVGAFFGVSKGAVNLLFIIHTKMPIFSLAQFLCNATTYNAGCQCFRSHFFSSLHRVHFVSAHFLKTFQLSRAFDMFLLACVCVRACVCLYELVFVCSCRIFFRDQK